MSEEFLKIIERIKEIKRLHTDVQVANAINMSKNNLYSFKNSKNLPLKHLRAFCEREGIMLEYIINGTLPVHGADPGPMPKIPGHGFGTLIKETTEPYGSNDTSSPRPKISDLLSKTAQVLESESIYGTALKSNIEAFHHALITDGEMKQMHNRLDNIDTEMKSMQDRLKRQEEELSSRELYPKSG